MTLKYFVAAGTVVVSTANCAHPVALTSGVGKDAANAGYSTCFPLQGTSSGDAALDRQLASDVETALAGKEWLDVAPQDAQVIVVTHVATPAKDSLDAFYRGWGDWTWRVASSTSPNEGREYTPGMEGPWQKTPDARLPADLPRIPASFLAIARVKH